MPPKTFLLPALAFLLAFTCLSVSNQASQAKMCGDPAFCGEGQLPPGTEPPPPGSGEDPEPETCPDDSTSLGEITVSAIKTAPLYPLVIGQDDTRRGVDIGCSVTVEPSTVTTYSHNAAGKCVRHVETYSESVTWSQVSANLDQASRDWILNGDLQIHYPGAYLHNPDLNVGACDGALNAQVADPGRFVINVTGTTSGTPIEGPRSFSLVGGEFLAYLREITITR